mgnify:FL=1
MLSSEAVKAIKKYKTMGKIISALVVEPWKPSKWKIKVQRMNFNTIVALNPKSPGHKKEKLNLAGMETWKVTAPNSDPDKILLYFHGGAYIVGSPKGYYPMLTHLARETGFTIYIPDYRLAPEHYFPAQLEDGVAAYDALINELGYSPDQIAFGGDSAGGNLSLVTLLKLKEQGKQLPSAVICLSPWANPAGEGESYNREIAEKDLILGPVFKRMWDEYGLENFGGYYVKKEDLDLNNPYICPVKGDFTDSPPIMVHTGGDEILLSDSELLISALERDSVDYEYKIWDGLWHVFQLEAKMPESVESFKQFGAFLNKHIGIKV